MDSLSGSFDGGIKRYFCRRKYRRLRGGSGNDRRQRRLQVKRLGGGSNYYDVHGPSRRRFWRIRTVPKIIVRTIWSPMVKLLVRLRNAYLSMMVNLAGKNGALNTTNFFGGKSIRRARGASPVIYSYNEVEDRIVLEIYKALKAYQT